MSNRAQRRAMMRAEMNRSKMLAAEYERSIAEAGRQKRIAGLIQNGITPEDVRKEYDRGLKEGFSLATQNMVKSCYAAVILGLKKEFGFDDEQCYQALMAVDHKMMYAIEHFELSDQVLQETGLELMLDDPISRVRKA